VRKFWRVFGWVFLGILLQFKFNVLYGIVFLENLKFHDRTYWVEMEMTPTDENLRVLKVKTTVHHSLGPDYFAYVYIPDNYTILNHKPYEGNEKPIPGYKIYAMNMKRKYRDVLAETIFILTPNENDISLIPMRVHFSNFKQILHKDESFKISTLNKKTQIKGPGPGKAEESYPQKLGM
tara:strand:- start:115 stop:651 length:537 start_codon:yes stop_codon:yes gene_type:complete